MLDPNPSIADLDAMLDRHRNDDAAMEKIIRGYLRLRTPGIKGATDRPVAPD